MIKEQLLKPIETMSSNSKFLLLDFSRKPTDNRRRIHLQIRHTKVRNIQRIKKNCLKSTKSGQIPAKQTNPRKREGQTSAQEDQVHSRINARHGNNVILGGSDSFTDPSEWVSGPLPTLPWIHAFEDPIGVIYDAIARLPGEPSEEQHENHEYQKRRP